VSDDARLKEEARRILGGKCANPDCRWANDDGTLGCKDGRMLMFHHIEGGGSESRREGGDSTRSNCYEIKRYHARGWPLRFRLLCANCHEMITKPQKLGARLHKQPARVRRSLQISGQEPRRVNISN